MLVKIANVFLNTTFVFLVKILQLPVNCSRSTVEAVDTTIVIVPHT